MKESQTATRSSGANGELPEHVLLWCEALAVSPLRRILPPARRPGSWTMNTLADYEAGCYCPWIAEWEAPAHESTADLADWVKSRLGYPVAIEKNPAGIEKPDWIRVLYGVWRADHDE